MITQDDNKVRIPRIIIAGISSDCGKTTIARGLMASLVRRGMKVQPFKVGPDFIDPSHHTRICNRISRNLDPVMMGESGVLDTFLRASAGADIAIIEGVMGMFDGIDGTTTGSTAHIARILDAPVILVIPVKGMSGSVHAIAEGFKNYDQQVNLTGVILNKVGSDRHTSLLKAGRTIEQLGFVPSTESLKIESRHLGLKMGREHDIPDGLENIMEESCDIDRILALAHNASSLTHQEESSEEREPHIRIGIAHDQAFCFYYQDNLDLLRTQGSELVFFSPMTDDLPDVDLLYCGGGYPELHTQALKTGSAVRQIRKAADNGMPIYAECGGLMYLGRGLNGEDASRWVGILPVEAYMERRFQALGYTIGICRGGPSFAHQGTEIRGHEFHYSRLDPDRDAQYAVYLNRGRGVIDGKDGIYEHNCMGSYTHAYFSRQFTRELVNSAKKYQKKEK